MHSDLRRNTAGAALLWLAACGTSPAPEAPGYDTPESVLYDATDDVCLVSNIQGGPLDVDDNGYIARVRADGSMQRHWIQGGRDGVTLNAPKGMALAGDVLWVADIDVLRKFDRRTGKPLGEVAIPGATFLNDVSTAPDGTVYCSDMGVDKTFAPTGTDAIWKIPPGGEPTALCKGEALGEPNGVVAAGGDVYFVSWRDGTFNLVGPKGTVTQLAKAPQGNLDGLLRVEVKGEGGNAVPVWYATSWAGSCVYRFDMNGGCAPLPTRLEQPADFGYDSKRAQLLVPLFGANKVERVPL